MKYWVLSVISLCSIHAAGQYVRLDPAFVPVLDAKVTAIAVQSDGKIVIGGQFTNVGGFSRPKLARLSRDGTLDESFSARADPSDYVGEIIVTASNIYAGPRRFDLSGNLEGIYPIAADYAIDSRNRQIWGAVTEYKRWLRLERFNEDGSVDSTFAPLIDECCLNRGVKAVAIQGDDGQEKILIGGRFGDVNGDEYHGLARLNEDGSTDTTFHGGVENPVVDIKIWKDGKFYTATQSSDGFGYVRRHLPDGTVDPAFAVVGGWNDFPSKIFPAEDGSVIEVTEFGNFIRRLRADGTLDTNFVIKLNDEVKGVAYQPDGGILIAGEFTNVNCIRRTYLARLIPSDTPDPLPCVPPPPVPEPELSTTRIRSAKMVCCWPTNYPDYTLQATRRLRPKRPNLEKWVTVTNVPAITDTGTCVTNRIARYGRYYRLVKTN